MAKLTLKALRENAESALVEGVANKDQLDRAVPALVALQDALRAAKANYDETRKVADLLSDACAEYAHEHTDYVFGNTFSISPIGVESGDITIGGRIFHYSRGFDGYMRDNPSEKMTKSFIAGLPPEWTKQKLELNASAVNALNLTDDALAEYGLSHKVRQGWFEAV